ncbi:MAG: hypothetical protein IT307_20115 [Chloroflexi bacterium]|nr:hypothetical protein [Chloroflexota bacterium]
MSIQAEGGSESSLEAALARTETDADAALRSAALVARALKRFRSAAQQGNLRELRPAITAAEKALAELGERLAEASSDWSFDEDGYFDDGAFARELIATAQQAGIRIFAEDDRLYCYPVLVRVLGGERAVSIDRVRERRLRPSVLVAHLKQLQARPQRFRSEAFLESLFSAYSALVGKQRLKDGRVEKLVDIYALLTLLPGSSKDYSRPEFARDLYLLDRSGVTETRGRYVAALQASTGSRIASSTIRVITESGQDRLYYGISFSPPA